MKILLVKRDKLGDLLLTTPLFATLRESFPSATIHLLANDYNSWVAEGHPALDKILVYPRVRVGNELRWSAMARQLKLYLELRWTHYDVVIVGQGEESPRAIKRGLWVGAPRTIAYTADGNHYGGRLTDALMPPGTGHELDRMLGLLRPLEIEPPSGLIPEYCWAAAGQNFAKKWLHNAGLQPGSYVVLGLGARQIRKQPNTKQILAWAKTITEKYQLQVVLMWTPGERGQKKSNYPGDDEIVGPILADCPPNLHPFRGSIQDALGLVFYARTSIFPDSGLMHFAAASPGGVLGLFANAPDFVEQWAPRGVLVEHLNIPAGIHDLSNEDFFEKLDALLTRTAREPVATEISM